MMTAYCASKSGVEAFAHSLRAEVGYQGVRVGVGYLSWTDTDMVRGADQDDVMRELRQRLPWASNKTYPLGPTVDRIVAGIERRSSHVYAQWWLRGMQSVRGLLSKASLQKPVTVDLSDGVAVVQVHVIAKYGSKIMPVCAKVQENVKQTIQNMTGITVSRVDVIVAGLEEPAADQHK